MKAPKQTTTTRNRFYGLNLHDKSYCGGADWLTKFHEASDISNIKLNPDGGFWTRKGRSLIATIADGIHSVGWYKDHAGTEYGILGAGGNIYTSVGGSGVPTVSTTVTTPDIKANMVNAFKFLFYCDGTNDNRKWDGTDWENLGIAGPTTPPTATLNSAVGVLNGEYTYFYEYVAKNAPLGYEARSQWSGVSNSVILALQQADIDVVASTDAQTTHIRIYRLSSVGGAEWQMVVELANATVTYTDNIADSALGPIPEFYLQGAPIADDGTPVKFDWAVMWKNRLWGMANGLLYNSVAGRPEEFYNNVADSPYQPMVIDPDNNEDGICAIPLGNMLVILTSSKIKYVLGDTEPFVIYDFMSNLGCLAARTARICKGRLIWLAADGLYCWNGTGEPFSISEKIDEDNNDGSKGIFNSTITALWGAAAEYVVADTSYWFSVPYGASVQNQRTFVLDLRLADLTDKASFYAGANPWTYYDFGFTDAISTTDRTLRTASSWKVGAANPYDYMLECIGTQDEGVDIAWKYLTRATDFGAPRHDKMFNECAVNVYTKQQTIVFKSIFDNGDFIDQMDFEVEGDEWDVAFWDEGVWSGSVGNFLIRNYRQAAVGMTVAFQITGVGAGVFYLFEPTYRFISRERSA